MTADTYLDLYSDCECALMEGRLLDALRALEGQLHFTGQTIMLEDVAQLRRDYSMLLEYFQRGVDDKFREENFNLFIRKAYRLNDRIHRIYQLESTGTFRAKVWHRLHLDAASVADVYVPFIEREDGGVATMYDLWADPMVSYLQLFDTVWTSDLWTKDDREAACSYARDPNRLSLNRLTFVSAVGMALLSTFDEEKFLCLFDLIDEQHLDVCVRASAMLFFALQSYADRLEFYPEIVQRIAAYSDPDVDEHKAEFFVTLLHSFQSAFNALLGTKEFLGKVKKEIDAAFKENLFPKLPGESDEEHAERMLKDEASMDKMDDILKSSMLLAKFSELGVDVTYPAFAKEGALFPFFNEAANWFCPCTNDHPLWFNLTEKTRFLTKMLNNFSCDTERFALLTVLETKEPQINIIHEDAETQERMTLKDEEIEDITKQLSEVADSIEKEMRMPPFGSEGYLKRLFRLIVHHVQDCNRFFNLFPYRNESENPIRSGIHLMEHPLLKCFFPANDELKEMAKKSLEALAYKPAMLLLDRYLKAFPADVEALDLYGLACCMAGLRTMGLKSLKEAYYLSPENNDIVQHVLMVAVEDKQWEDVVEVLQGNWKQLDDRETLEHFFVALKELSRNAEALGVMQKLCYLHPDDMDYQRDLAWLYVLNREFAKAAELYEKIMMGEPTATDFRRAGHTALLQEDIPTAIAYYQEFIARAEKPLQFSTMEQHVLCSAGLNRRYLQFVLDILELQ